MKIHNDVEKFVNLTPSLYRFLKSINFNRNIDSEGCTRYDIEIVLTKISEHKIEDMKIRCTNAVDIKVGEIESMFAMLFDIEDISSSQLEGISYRISEQENNTFSFSCSDFFVELIN